MAVVFRVALLSENCKKLKTFAQFRQGICYLSDTAKMRLFAEQNEQCRSTGGRMAQGHGAANGSTELLDPDALLKTDCEHVRRLSL